MTVGYDIVVKRAMDKCRWTFASLDKREGLRSFLDMLNGLEEPRRQAILQQ
jgi:hypothetical protein